MKRHALIVDDNAANLFALSSMLKKLQVCHESATNGSEAVRMYKENPCELVLMDLNMPIMNGMEASKEITNYARVKGLSVYIVILSAQDEPADKSECLRAGIKSWITKPVNFKELKQLIEKLNNAI